MNWPEPEFFNLPAASEATGEEEEEEDGSSSSGCHASAMLTLVSSLRVASEEEDERFLLVLSQRIDGDGGSRWEVELRKRRTRPDDEDKT